MQKKSINNRKKREKAITLIALVITVIILLILAGTAISMGLNEGELFGHTNNSVERYNEKVAEMENSLTNAMGMLDKVANPDLAKYKLEVKVNYDEEGNETAVESPYYVWYPSKKYIDESEDEECKGIKCRVLYNDSTYGLQIISVEPPTNVILGRKDTNDNLTGEIESLERAQSSYMRAVTTLNEAAEEYMETKENNILATDARCVGSNVTNKNYPDNAESNARSAEIFSVDDSITYMREFNGKFFKKDMHHTTDLIRLRRMNLMKTGETKYWVASRCVYCLEGVYYFGVKWIDTNGYLNESGIWNVNPDETTKAGGGNRGLRPIFVLANNVKITGGQGTEEDPFELGL